MSNKHRPTPHDVLWMYRVLLGRDPESRATIDSAAKMPSISHLRASILRSEEFQRKFSAQEPPNADSKYSYENFTSLRADVAWHSLLSVDDVRIAYNAVLGRDIENLKIALEHIKNTPDLFSLITSLLESPEFQGNSESNFLLKRFQRRLNVDGATERVHSRVLLFGAYGNGNLGDMCQSKALSEMVESFKWASSVPLTVQSSWARSGNSFEGPVATSYDEILDPEALAKYRLVMIGGGGLLATPHFPLYVESWVRGLKDIGTPYAIVGVGASYEECSAPGRVQAYHELINNALFVSGRDRESLDSMRRIRADVHFVPDPHFLMNFKAVRLAAAPKEHRKIVMVAKAPINDSEQVAVEFLAELQQRCAAEGIPSEVIFFESYLDAPISKRLGNAFVVNKVSEFHMRIADATVVYSMRYHGLVYSLCNHKTCWAIGARKNIDLFNEIGLSDFTVVNGEIPSDPLIQFGDSHWRNLATYYEAGVAGLDACAQAIKGSGL